MRPSIVTLLVLSLSACAVPGPSPPGGSWPDEPSSRGPSSPWPERKGVCMPGEICEAGQPCMPGYRCRAGSMPEPDPTGRPCVPGQICEPSQTCPAGHQCTPGGFPVPEPALPPPGTNS